MESEKIETIKMPEMSVKWHWKMDFCKELGIPPAQAWAWDKAEQAYNDRND